MIQDVRLNLSVLVIKRKFITLRDPQFKVYLICINI